MTDKVVIFGGGTFNPVSCHLSLAAPAFGSTARDLTRMFKRNGTLEPQLILTKMADHTSKIITNDDLQAVLDQVLFDQDVKAIVMNAAICDFSMESPSEDARLSSANDYPALLKGIKTKLLGKIKSVRPDIVVVGFKTTSGASQVEQVAKAFNSLHVNAIDIVLANDVGTRVNFIVSRDLTVQKGSREFLLGQLVDHTVIAHNMKTWGLEE